MLRLKDCVREEGGDRSSSSSTSLLDAGRSEQLYLSRQAQSVCLRDEAAPRYLLSLNMLNVAVRLLLVKARAVVVLKLLLTIVGCYNNFS